MNATGGIVPRGAKLEIVMDSYIVTVVCLDDGETRMAAAWECVDGEDPGVTPELASLAAAAACELVAQMGRARVAIHTKFCNA